jgi:5'-phosphate synthase pdxT subunit
MNLSSQNLAFDKYNITNDATELRVGILALQGDFLEHANMLRRLGVIPIEIRLPADLVGISGLIIPGGESTTIGKLATQFGLVEPLQEFISKRRPVWGTCAGMIFLAKEIGSTGSGGHVIPPQLGMMNIRVNRNAYGRQTDSFEADLQLTFANNQPFRAVFIRAPRIESKGADVEVLAQLDDGTPVAVRQDNMLVTAFHPELTDDTRLHHYFMTMIKECCEVQS